ncbi:MAG: hypothetical protein Q9N68_12760 [Gammaproteobacteria bacterium]|nr:hypothetical protein [Gammaproteobacteria bacterium]
MNSVLRCAELEPKALEAVLAEYGLQLIWLAEGETITGSFWGDEEAGLVANRLYVRPDTPVHSALHEACHYLCMDGQRRVALDTDAAGDYDEENGVCYLQIVLADRLPMRRERMWADMDAWGYSFRLGSAQAWFEGDAEDALLWLQRYGLLDETGRLTGRLRV